MGNGPTQRDYNLTDRDSEALVANGLAAAAWYKNRDTAQAHEATHAAQ